MFILDHNNSIANNYLRDLRHNETQKDRLRFRRNLVRLGEIMAYEISKRLSYNPETVNTPLGNHESHVVDEYPILITVLRAGIPFHQGFLNIFDHADSGFIGSYRAKDGNQHEVEISSDYEAMPNPDGRNVILVDPMVATGKSLVNAVNQLLRKGNPKHIYLVSVISSKVGVDYIENNLDTDYSIWTASMDEHLNNKAYIVPGLGDAGDLAFGPKH